MSSRHTYSHATRSAAAAAMLFMAFLVPLSAEEIQVSTKAELDAALDATTGGTTISLESGYYGSLGFWQRHNSSPATIRAAPGHRPRFDRITIRESSNWVLSGLDVSPRHAGAYDLKTAVTLEGSDMVIEHCTVSFADDITGWSADDWLSKTGNGMQISGTRMTVRNNLIRNVAHGISVSASHSLITRNQISNFRADGLRGLGDHCVFEYNLVTNAFKVDDNHDDCFQSWSHGSDGKVGTGAVRGVVLRGNTFIGFEDPDQPLRGTAQGIGCFDGTFVDWVIENNVVMVNHWHGITLMGAENCRIVNNTVMDLNDEVPGPAWIRISNHKNGTPPSGCLVRNNLSTNYNNAGTGVTVDHNLTIDDPGRFFVNAAALDLRLKHGAAAIDIGSTQLTPSIDMLGTVRPQGAGIDVGAYEFVNGDADNDPPAAPTNVTATVE